MEQFIGNLKFSLLGKPLYVKDLFPNLGRTESTAQTPAWMNMAMAAGMLALAVGVTLLTKDIQKSPEETR